MKSFWAFLLAARISSASHATFSVLEDILGFPQYEVGITNAFVSESEADARIAALTASKARSGAAPGLKQDTRPFDAAANTYTDDDPSDPIEGVRDFTVMTLKGQRYLCSIPIVTPETSSDEPSPSPEETEKELVRATVHGEELLRGMQGNCIYFNTGWWTYSFCYNQTVRQFHAMPPGGNYPFYPPWADSKVPIYSLGEYAHAEQNGKIGNAGRDAKTIGSGKAVVQDVAQDSLASHHAGGVPQTGLARLEQKGELKYLVQKLDGGTLCDLTGKPRRIEVQFHCMPDSVDRIAAIKELATCTYLMVIHTPRLCKDVAFHPPAKDRPNPIRCSAIVPDGADPEKIPGLSFLYNDQEPQHELPRTGDPIIVGDVELGANRIVVPASPGAIAERKDDHAPVGGWLRDRPSLADSLVLGGQREKLIGTVAWSDRPPLTDAELIKLGLRGSKKEGIPGYVKQMKDAGKGKKWRIDAVSTANGKEFRGIIETEEEVVTDGSKPVRDEKVPKKGGKEKKDEADTPDDGKAGSGGGSEERYYDEL